MKNHHVHVIPILGRDYVIRYVDGFDDPNCYGELCSSAGEIHVKRGLSKKEIRETLVHETCHGILRESGLTDVLEACNSGLEEAIVMALDHGLNRSGLIRKVLPPPDKGKHE
jgi:hypothetical protein